MKSIITTCLFLIFCSVHLLAQTITVDSLLRHKINPEETPLATSKLNHYIHKNVYIYDVISSGKIINDTLKILYVGGKYPNYKVAVFIKGSEPNKHAKFISGKKLHFSGFVFIYHGKPAMTITDPSQLGIRVLI